MHTNTIKNLLKAKGERPVVSVTPQTTVFDAVTSMVENNIGSVLVTENERIFGIMSERDYLRFVTLQGQTAQDTPVSQLMTRKVVYVTPETALSEVMAIMTKERIRHVPVLEGQTLLAIVSIGDVVKQISQDQTAHIKVLTEYITDAYPGPAQEAAKS